MFIYENGLIPAAVGLTSLLNTGNVDFDWSIILITKFNRLGYIVEKLILACIPQCHKGIQIGLND